MSSIQEAEKLVGDAREKLQRAEAMLAELKKNPAPCPLEEGKTVGFSLTVDVLKQWYEGRNWYAGIYGDLSVVGGKVRMEFDWHNKSVALDHARALLRAAGEKED